MQPEFELKNKMVYFIVAGLITTIMLWVLVCGPLLIIGLSIGMGLEDRLDVVRKILHEVPLIDG